jgi:hypothetical protein
MSRNPQLEAIFEARYAWENAAVSERARRLAEYHKLRMEAATKAGVKNASQEELEDALIDAYREFRRAKRLEERAKLSRIR